MSSESSSGARRGGQSRDGEVDSHGDGGDSPALPLDMLSEFAESLGAPPLSTAERQDPAESLPFESGYFPGESAEDTKPASPRILPKRNPRSLSLAPHKRSIGSAEPPRSSSGDPEKLSLGRIQVLLQECAQALEALVVPNHRVSTSGSSRRSVVRLPSTSGSLSHGLESPSARSMRRVRESVSCDLIGSATTSASGLAIFDHVRGARHADAAHRASLASNAAAPVPAAPNLERRRTRVQFQDEGPEEVDTADESPRPSLTADDHSNALPTTASASTNPSMSSNRENRRDGDAPRRGVLATSAIATALDVAYILASLAICIATVTYLALYRTSPGNDDAQVSTPICITAIVVGQAVSMAWCGSRFVVQTRKGEWEIVDRVADIAQLYRRTWLAFDLFCVVPFEWVCLGWATDYAFWLSLRQLVRFGRFLSLIRSGNPLRDTRNTVRMLAFVAFVTFTIHCLAVIFQQIQNESNGPSEQLNYVGALYWAAMTLTSVGYGDVLPVADDWHRIYACVVMFSGVAMIASVTAFATSVLTTTDALQDAIKERKLMLASMIEYYRIPWEVEVEITALLPTALNAENEHKFTQLVSHMPAFMVERIEGYTRAKALSTSIPLFVELPVSVVLELTAHLHQRFYQANECIIQIGDEGREMFFIVTGTAEVVMPLGSDEEVIVAVLRGGSFFGEVALVQDVQRTASVIAVTLCELLVLSKVNFTNLVTRHVELRDIFLKEVFARHNITNLVKHELSIARREQVDDFTAVGDLHETADPRPDANPLALE